jgi:hypothetical protein
VADVMPLDAFRKQSFAAALTPARKSRPTAFGAHPRTKAVLSFPCPLGWLISAFHKWQNGFCPVGERLRYGHAQVCQCCWYSSPRVNALSIRIASDSDF